MRPVMVSAICSRREGVKPRSADGGEVAGWKGGGAVSQAIGGRLVGDGGERAVCEEGGEGYECGSKPARRLRGDSAGAREISAVGAVRRVGTWGSITRDGGGRREPLEGSELEVPIGRRRVLLGGARRQEGG